MEPIAEMEQYLLHSTESVAPRFNLSYAVDGEQYRYYEHLARDGAVFRAKPDRLFRARAISGSTLVLHRDDPEEDRHAVIRSGFDVHIVAPKLTAETARAPLRTCREIALRTAQNSGGLVVHAACVVIDDLAYLILGDSGVGKSTLMWTLLEQGARYLANDRTIVRVAENGALLATSWPLGARLGRGLVNNQRLLDPASFRFSRQSGANVGAGADTPVWGERYKYELTPLEIERLSGRPLATSARIAGLVMPRLSMAGGAPYLSSLSPEAAEGPLRRSIMDPCDEDFLTGWLGLRTITDLAVLENIEVLASIARALPALAVEGHPEQLRGINFADALAAMGGGRTAPAHAANPMAPLNGRAE